MHAGAEGAEMNLESARPEEEADAEMEAVLPVSVSLATTSTPTPMPRKTMDLKDMLDELPMLAALKDQKWMGKLPRGMFPKKKKAHTASPSIDDGAQISPNAGSETELSPFSPESLPTPRTAMSMSVLVPANDDDLLDSLDPRFFTESFDAVAHMLVFSQLLYAFVVFELLRAKRTPSLLLPVRQDSIPDNRDELNQFMRTEISAVDVAKDVILARLKDAVRANYNSLIQGMKVVQEVDLDLVRAQIHVKNGRRQLSTAKNDLIISSLEIIKTKRNRDRVKEISKLGSQIVLFFEEEDNMNTALEEHRFTTAVDICISLREGLSRGELLGLTILDEIRQRTQDFIPKLRAQFDQSLRKVAEHFDPLQYKELLQAYITLADHAENLDFEFSSYSLSEVLSNIPEIIVRCIDDMTSRFMHDMFDTKSPKKPKIAEGSNQNEETAEMQSTPTSQTIEKVTRCYEKLTDLMHTYYLLVQWHRDPFDPRNDDVEYLHRCGIDDDDDDDDEDDEDDNEENEAHHADARGATSTKLGYDHSKRRRRSSVTSEAEGAQRSPYDQVLCATGMTLLRYRKIVWESIQQNVLEALERLDMTYGYKMEHVIALSLATITFTEIGEEFTGTPSSKIRSVLRVKCEQYLHAFHDDNMELMRMLLDTESWQRVTTPMPDGDDKLGLLRLIEKRGGYFFEQKARGDLAVNPIYFRRVFPSFRIEGNPFSATNVIEWLSLKKGIRFQHEDNGAAKVPGKNNPESPCGDDERTVPVMDPNESEFVLNSSTLAGFVRLCGVYLKMMEHLPQVAWDVFRLLSNLYEFNTYAVFTNFVAEDDIVDLFQGKAGCRGKADAARWNGLQSGICRFADEFGSGEVLLEASVLLYPTATDPGRVDQQSNAPISRKVTLRRLTRTPTVVENANEDNLYALAESSIACETIIGQSRLLGAIEDLARSYLPDRYLCLMDEAYERNRAMANDLRSFMYATIAMKLVDVSELLDSIASVAWSINYIREEHNDYIVHLVRKCGEAWGGLQILADGSIPMDAREEIWAAMVQTIMDTLLQGFSAVTKCTPQGRALMSMDLHALQNGLDLINHISSRTVPRGREHVGNYIRAFYYDEDELLDWIEANKTLYSKLEFANLIKNGIGSTMDLPKLRELVRKIDAVLG